MRHRWLPALPLALLIAATAAVAASVPLRRVNDRLWANERDSLILRVRESPEDPPDLDRFAGSEATIPPGDVQVLFLVAPAFPERILDSLGLRGDTWVGDAELTSFEPTGRELRLPSGRWREYAATPGR